MSKADGPILSAIVAAIRSGQSQRGAAETVGVTTRAIQKWIQRGRDGEEPYASFEASYRAAQSVARTERISAAIAKITGASMQAAAA